jgi:subtilisin
MVEQKDVEQKDDSVQAGKSAQFNKRATPPGGATERPVVSDRSSGERPAPDRSATEAGAEDKSSTAKPSVTVLRRKQRYMIGFRPMPGIAANPNEPFLEKLALMDGVEIIRRLRPRSQTRAAGGTSVAREIVVAQMDEQRGEALRQSAPPHVVVEIDAPLGYCDMTALEPTGWQPGARTMPFPGSSRDIRFSILGEGDRPLAGASVYLYGSGFLTQAISEPSGQAVVRTFDVDGADIRAVYVRPAADHWESYIQNPSLELQEVNIIRLSPLGRNPTKFPGERPHSWGQRMMKLDRIPPEWTGVGVKIGIIDSGCDNTHPILNHVALGADLTRDNEAHGWKFDELGQGTHCAGIVGGSTAASTAMVGCAPGAELHAFKVVPGGHFSDLIDALDQCIERRLDVIQLGISSERYSGLVAQKITEVCAQGIACIAGAGNSGGPVQFPGNVPGVLAVSAVGKLGEFPPDTCHAYRALPQLIAFTGIFATNFSGGGPQVAVCAPGVAIVSSVPGGGYAAWDGSSMAASHVTGFAALLLSNHPMLQRIHYDGRAEQRVAVLFELIRASAIPYAQVDPQRVGAGLPDLQQVPAMLASAQPPAAGILQAASVAGSAWPGLIGSPYSDRQAMMVGGNLMAAGLPAGLAPAAYLNDPLALMQLRPAVVWI